MKNSKFRKGLSLLLSILMIFTMFPVTLFAAAEDNYPVMEKFTAASSTEFHAYYGSIYSATFLDKIDWEDINSSYLYWDSSANNDNSVIAYIKLNAEQTGLAGANRYDLYIAGDGGVGANPDSGFIFYFFSALEEVRGCENFKTSNATSFNGMFYECKNLRSITGINWDTSNVTDMSYMFRNCHELTELNLSSFDTSKVTTMKYMFYYCQKLEHIYIGPGWTTESIANLNDGVFNCCYAIVGGKENYDKDHQYFPPGAEYAKLREDGGFLDLYIPNEYNVTYSFIGDVIPEGISAPKAEKYEEGTVISIADAPSADRYIFSGWSTSDTTVDENGEFTLSNDVHFVGSWEKLYKVEYRYTEGFLVPDGAPELPEAVYYKAGDWVDVNGVPYVDGYLFIGWSTKDADIAGYMFDMPENDVVLYGYFKKPVESVEFMGGDISINIDDTKTKLNVYVKPEDATIKDLTYESGDESIVTVDKYGFITPVSEGTTTVTVASKDDPTKSDTITVTVKIPVTELTVDKTEINLNKGDTDKITATVTPDEATDKEIIYTSDDENVVKVDENGNIEAIGEGKATITVSSKDNPQLTQEVTVTVKVPVTEVTATEDFTINIGEEKNVEAKTNDDATNKELIYESSKPSIVKVNDDGTVVGVGEGTATITITSKDDPTKTETVEVTVKIPVIGISPENRDIILEEGQSDTIKVTVKPENATEKGLVFESSDETIVKVDENGNIETVGEGKATITVTSKDNPEISEEVTVTVIRRYEVTYEFIGDVIPENVTAPKSKKYINGSEVTVEDDASAEDYIFSGWSTKDVTVTDGKFTISSDVHFVGSWTKINYYNVTYRYEGAIPEGAPAVPSESTYKEGSNVAIEDAPVLEGYIFSGWTTKDTIVTDGGFIINNDVEFIGKWEKIIINVESIITEKNEFTLTEGETDKITVTVKPDDATNKEVTYESSDEAIVKVDENGNIEAIGEGEATITITSKDGAASTTVTVKVEKPETPPEEPEIPEDIPVDEIITEKNEFILTEGETDKITVTVKPDDATNKEVTYESSDEAIVKVDENGNIEAVGEGEATITITSKDGAASTTVTVKVEKPETPPEEPEIPEYIPVDEIITDKNEFTLTEGETDKITVTVKPDDATNKEVTYESSDESIVKVDENGNIEAIGEGEATITITSKDGSASTTVTVKVEKPETPPEEPEIPEEPEYVIEVPDGFNIYEGETLNLGVKVTPEGYLVPTYTSADESIVTVDAEGNIKGIKAGATTITVDFGNGEIRIIPIVVLAPLPIPRKHYVAFGKTDGIGWYEVSVNGGDFFPQGPNSTLEVEEGSVLVVRVQDMWIDDEFDFYVNGNKVPMDPANTITVVVDGYMLIGALSMDVEVPDVEESLSLFDKIVKAFKDFFNWIKSWFE